MIHKVENSRKVQKTCATSELSTWYYGDIKSFQMPVYKRTMGCEIFSKKKKERNLVLRVKNIQRHFPLKIM